jgi:dCTP deaminase
MGVLCDEDIFKRLMKKEITIHPILDAKQIQGAKVDLRLANVVYLIKHFEQPCYDPRDRGEEIAYGDERYLSFYRAEEKIRARFILQPGDFAIAPLFERVRLPNYILGRLDGRSSLGRLGIVVHATAGGIDPGYSGHITCELSNLGKVPVALYPLQRIASLTLETISNDAVSVYRERPDRKYVDSLATRLSLDREFASKILDMIADRL